MTVVWLGNSVRFKCVQAKVYSYKYPQCESRYQSRYKRHIVLLLGLNMSA